MPVPFIKIRLIRARLKFLKHQDSFNSLNSCSKKIKFVFVKNKISVLEDKIRVQKDKIRVQKDKIRVPCTASPAIHVVCVYVRVHTHAPACVYFIR